MILLFQPEEKAFDNNGLGALSDALSCKVTEEENGVYEVEMQYPLGGIHFEDIANRFILFVKSGPWRDKQPFRIYRITKPLSGKVTIYARHISYDLSGVVCSPFKAGSCTEAMLRIKNYSANDNPFEFITDIEGAGQFEVKVPSGVRSLLGGSEGSLLDVYGGQYEFDRWNVFLRSRRGQDRGVTIRYGKNLTDLKQDENIANVATGVYPYWVNEETMVTLPEKYIEASGDYSFTRIMPLDLSSDFEEEPTVDQLREKAVQYMKDNKIGVPSVSITVEFQALEQTEEYKDIALLERVDLCDTVTVEYLQLGVSATAKCVKTVYDALLDRYVSIELGDVKSNFVDAMIQQKKDIEEKIPKASAWQEAVEHATKLITGNLGGYVVLRDQDGDDEPDEILIMDTKDINTAKNVWRWNAGGLGHSANGYNGPYSDVALTMDGWINGKRIVSLELDARQIVSGIIMSTDMQTFINLDTGQFQFKDKLRLEDGDLLMSGRLCDASNPGVYAEVGEADGCSAFVVSAAEYGKCFAVYEVADGAGNLGTVWTAPSKTNDDGTCRKGIIIYKNKIGMFCDNSKGVDTGSVYVDSSTGIVNIIGKDTKIQGKSFIELCQTIDEELEALKSDVKVLQLEVNALAKQ